MYKVRIDDNFHYQEVDECRDFGTFATAEEALAACRRLVLASLLEGYKPGMTGAELYDHYRSFGDDPFVVAPPGASSVTFSGWEYARDRAAELCGKS
jgi:hypothetical protein